MDNIRGRTKYAVMLDDASFSEGLPQGRLFSLSGSNMINDIPKEIQTYWIARYGSVYKFRNTDEKPFLLYYTGKGFADPKNHLLVIEGDPERFTYYQDGEKIELNKLLEQAKSFIYFV